MPTGVAWPPGYRKDGGAVLHQPSEATDASGQNQTDESGAPSAISRSSAARGGFEACDSIH
jgi:hypothetical protein